MPGDPLDDQRGLPDREAADDDAAHADIEQPTQARFVANTTASLHFETEPGQSLEHLEVLEAAIARTVEIDHVQPARPAVAIAPALLHGIDVVAGFARVVALAQTHDATTAQVEGRNDLEAHESRKFLSRRAPTAAERSGWNCMPWKLRWRTIAARALP